MKFLLCKPKKDFLKFHPDYMETNYFKFITDQPIEDREIDHFTDDEMELYYSELLFGETKELEFIHE